MEHTSPCSSVAAISCGDISLISIRSSPATGVGMSAITINDSGYSESPQSSPSTVAETASNCTDVKAEPPCTPVQVISGDGDSPLAKLMERTRCSILQQNGQRRFGPPCDWQGPPPPRGTEVFVGKIPRDCFEDELVPLFEKAGKIYEFRLMMDQHTSQNRGYAFVVYSTVNEAKECVRNLNNVEVRRGRTLGICASVDNCRLFIGGIPKRVSKLDIFHEMQKVTEGVVDVIVYPSAVDKTKNRGFAFIEYESHRSAAMARRKLMNGRVQLWGHNIAVDWAEPELEVDQEIMAQVKVLYVRNLMLGTSEAQIEEAFNAHAPVERVKKIKDYAFVHLTSKEDAHISIEKMNGTVLDGAVIEVTLAKPVDKETYLRSPKYQRQFNSPAIYVPVDQYGTVLPFYPSYLSSPKYMLRNSMGACTMVRLPRLPFKQRPGGQNFYPVTCSSSTPRFFPTSPVHTSPPAAVIPAVTSAGYYELPRHIGEEAPIQTFPAAALAHTQAVTAKPKTSVQLLEEICQKSNWPPPVYTLHSTSSSNQHILVGEDVLFLYKVTLSAIGMTYMPSKLSRTVDEARYIAADYTLSNLGLPIDSTTATGYMVRQPLQYTEMPATYVGAQSPNKPVPAVWAAIGGGGDPTVGYAPAYMDSTLSGVPQHATHLF